VKFEGSIITIAGGTGLIGKALKHKLEKRGAVVRILTRNRDKVDGRKYFHWNPAEHSIDEKVLSDCKAVVNLAGAGVMSHSWSATYKKIILESRVNANKTLEQAAQNCSGDLHLVSASAIGHYGYHASEVFDENNRKENGGYLQEVVTQWEAAAKKTALQFSNHTILRIGIVLSNRGGALTELINGFKFGFGSYFDPGNQYYSWIHIEDVCGIVCHVLEKRLTGTFNTVAPNPVTAKTMSREIAKKLYGKVRLLPIPKPMSALILGERHHMLTGSANVSAQRIMNSNYKFNYPAIDLALGSFIRDQKLL
jgi:uncharacterized protein (TIGR01777 family)